MAISSQYYKDISKVEKKIWGVSLRHMKAYLFLGFTGGILCLEVFFLPNWTFLLLSIPTAILLGFYPVLLLLDQWKAKKRDIELLFYYEERAYKTGQIRSYEKNEFIQESTIHETDPID